METRNTRNSSVAIAIMIVAMPVSTLACVGEPPPPPSMTGMSTSSAETATDGTTTGATTTSTATTTMNDGSTTMLADGDSTRGLLTTGPVAECGNNNIEEGEECDGEDWNGATCQSLGYTEGVPACINCQFDVSNCGPPLGMIEVPGGEFEMGADFIYVDQQPIRQIFLDTFWIDETEVSAASYSDCVAKGCCTEPLTGEQFNYMAEGREEHPINGVSWIDAWDFCECIDKRLPTEAEWEKAARGTDARRYPWGDAPGPSCTHVVKDEAAAGGAGCGEGSTWPVGSKPLGNSPYGARDMSGNVWEWVADWYGEYDASDIDNPTGPELGTDRVQRGGGWAHVNTDDFHSTYRNSHPPENARDDLGFRCAWPRAAI